MIGNITSFSTYIQIDVKPLDEYNMNGLLAGIDVYYRKINLPLEIKVPSNIRRRSRASNIRNRGRNRRVVFQRSRLYVDHSSFYGNNVTKNFTVGNLSYFTNYEIYVQYFTAAGSGPSSKTFTVRTKEDGEIKLIMTVNTMFVINDFSVMVMLVKVHSQVSI